MAARHPRPAHHPATLLPAGVRGRRFVLPPLPITDDALRFFLMSAEFASANPHSPHWLGFMLMASTRRVATSEEHRAEIAHALRSAVRRKVIALIRHRDTKELFFALSVDVDEGVEVLSDRLVPAPKLMRPFETPPEPPPVVVKAPPPPPPPRKLILVDAPVLFDIAKLSPWAVAFYVFLRSENFDEPERKIAIDVHAFAAKLGWPPQRIEASVRILLSRRYLKGCGRDPSVGTSSSGAYWFGERGLPKSEAHPT
jgi:hypothetical protein